MILDPATVLRSIFGRLLVDAEAAGVMIPHGLEPSEVIVFYSDGRPVEAMASGTLPDGDAWVTDPAPRWTTQGRLLPEDDERPHSYARADGSWGNRRRTRAAMSAYQLLEDLAESTIDLPEDLQRVARLVLERLAGAGEENAGYALAEAGRGWRIRLAEGLKKRVADMRRATGMDAPWPGPADERGVTEAAAAWMAETFPNGGAESAEELRQRAKASPWAPWWPEDGEDFAFLLRRLTRLVWRNGLEAEAERARRTRPALPRVTAVDVSDVATRNAFLPGLDDGLVRSSKGGVRATISGGVVDVERVREGLALMPSMPFHRMVRTLVHAGYDQAEAGVEDYRVVSVPGGYAGLTERLELSAKYRKDVRLIAEAGARIEWRIGGRQGIAWWTLDAPVPGVTFAHRGQGAEVTFTLGTMLLPYAARRMRQQQTLADDAIDRRLVPELRYDPPMYGRGNEQAAIYTMARRFLTFMVDNGLELARDGGIVVTPEQWAKLAKASGLPAVLALKVVKKWADGDGDAAPPLIEYLDGGLVRLSETYRAEHDFIVDGVRRRAKRDQDIKRAHQRRKQES